MTSSSTSRTRSRVADADYVSSTDGMIYQQPLHFLAGYAAGRNLEYTFDACNRRPPFLGGHEEDVTWD
jgi:hypothetical protein